MGSLGIAVVNIVGWAGFIFAFWMWVDALGVRSERWPAVGWTKTRWFVVWYVSCILTFGLASIALAIYFYRNLRPTLRAASATTPPGSQLNPPDRQRQGGPVPSKGVVRPPQRQEPHLARPTLMPDEQQAEALHDQRKDRLPMTRDAKTRAKIAKKRRVQAAKDRVKEAKDRVKEARSAVVIAEMALAKTKYPAPQ